MSKKPALLLSLLNLVLRPIAGQTLAQPVALSQCPPAHDREAWSAYWKAQSQPWRTEPEIDKERQEYLAQQRADIKQGMYPSKYPFKGIKLGRADVEWLLITHENGRGPVHWSDESQRSRTGLDLRGADLSQVNLSGLPLACIRGGLSSNEWPFPEGREERDIPSVCLRGANLSHTQLQGANLRLAQLQEATLMSAQLQEATLMSAQLQGADLGGVQLQGASLQKAELQRAYLVGAQLQGANLEGAQLQGANLGLAQLQKAYLVRAQLQGAQLQVTQLQGVDLHEAQLQGTDLRRADLENVSLDDVVLSDKNHGTPRFADVRWNNVNLAVIKWSQVKILGDEHEARQRKESDGKKKDKVTRIREHEDAVRANRQLAVVLQSQGLNEVAARFAYRAQALQKHVFWFEMIQQGVKLRQRGQALGAWLFSWFLNLLAGYGYKLWRSFLAYLLIIALFMTTYHIIDPYLTWSEAFVVSMTAFHGRGFSPSTFTPGDPLSFASAAEAFVGLIIEVTFIATLTQRFFNR